MGVKGGCPPLRRSNKLEQKGVQILCGQMKQFLAQVTLRSVKSGVNGKLDEESVDEAMRDRCSHIKSCIERLQDELEITEQFENELRAELLDDEI